jgi:DNA polymerase III subunit beta
MEEWTASGQGTSRSPTEIPRDVKVLYSPHYFKRDRQHQLKLTVSRETFLARLGIAVRGASTRSAIQTLSGVLLRVDDGRAELQATDMELGVRVALEARDSAAGQAVIPARLLLDVVRSLPKDELTLEYRSSHQDVEVVSGPARFHLRTLPTEDFPKLPDAPAEAGLSVPADAFVDTIGRVARAASRDETRPHLTGVLVTASGNELRMVATDSYRLSVKETALESALTGDLEANVPARTLQELGRIATAGEAETIGVAALENQVIFTVGDVVLSSRLVEGRFPNYQQLLPESYEHELKVSREELLEVVRRIGLLAQKNAPLRLRFSEGALDVSAQTPDVGEASESLPVPFSGEELEIGFNPEFFRDGLDSAESEELVLKLISPLRPGLIESSGENGGFRYLVMPIRLNV